MAKTKIDNPNLRELVSLLRVRSGCSALSLTCTAMSLTLPLSEEREAWKRSARQISDVSLLIDYSIRDARRRGDDAFVIVETMPVQWIHRALDAVGVVRGIAFMHEARYGSGTTFLRLSGDLRAAHNALLDLNYVHCQHGLERAGIEALERAETEAMILRAAKKIIRPRARGSVFDVGVSEVPSYTVDPDKGVHRIRVSPRWRSLVQRLGTATPRDFVLMLDAEPVRNGTPDEWWVTCAHVQEERRVYVRRMTWYRPDLADAAA